MATEQQRVPNGGNSHQRAVQRAKWEKQATVLAPLIAKKLPPTETKPSPRYHSTPLWGAVGLAGTIVCTVVPAITRDVRWLLFGALPFLSIIIWEIVGPLVVSTKRRIAFTGLISAALAIGLVVWYVKLKPENPNADSTSPQASPQLPTSQPSVGITFQNSHFGGGGPGMPGVEIDSDQHIGFVGGSISDNGGPGVLNRAPNPHINFTGTNIEHNKGGGLVNDPRGVGAQK